MVASKSATTKMTLRVADDCGGCVGADEDAARHSPDDG